MSLAYGLFYLRGSAAQRGPNQLSARPKALRNIRIHQRIAHHKEAARSSPCSITARSHRSVFVSYKDTRGAKSTKYGWAGTHLRFSRIQPVKADQRRLTAPLRMPVWKKDKAAVLYSCFKGSFRILRICGDNLSAFASNRLTCHISVAVRAPV